MALDLKLWAQLNLIGHVSYQDYLLMDQEEAVACLQALNAVINEAKQTREAEDRARQSKAALDAIEAKYRNGPGPGR